MENNDAKEARRQFVLHDELAKRLASEFPKIDLDMVYAVQEADRNHEEIIPVLVHTEVTPPASVGSVQNISYLCSTNHHATDLVLDALRDEIGDEPNAQIINLTLAIVGRAVGSYVKARTDAHDFLDLYASVMRRLHPNVMIIAIRLVENHDGVSFPGSDSDIAVIERTGMTISPTRH